ncbi:metallophosphoesterase [Gilvimarinus xylanilyticus]|uniref:Metallophosphoesterase n=1 Tax=Gilvimarinus xylanilyticus TaxID=2944139 RepID=A0A9X2KS64_9GAMM|nr:metallophosphoesterase [Gilvimarinus xylanilyticus]MCP8897914.1 metallophosphoesterase [Gilvimarinus xylanilyticus]
MGSGFIRVVICWATLVSLNAQAHSDSSHTSGEISIESSAGQTPWTHLDFNNDPQAFQFAIVTDRTGGLRPGVFSQAVDKLNLLQPEFVVSVGDLIEGYTDNRAQLETEWNEFDSMVQRLDMPFFYLAGNHDYTNPVMADVWRERYGDSYYHFTYRDVLFVMLNSNDGGKTHTFSQAQIDWLETTLKENPEPQWTLIFTHSPLWDRDEKDRWDEIESLLGERPYTVFAGHHHRYVKDQRHGRKYFTLATTGGITSGRGTRFGEFDHVVWVTMSEQGPIIANMMLDGIWGEDVRTAEMRDLQTAMIDKGRLSLPAILYRDKFKKGVAQLRLKNDSDTPYQFKAQYRSLGKAKIEGENSLNITVPPNEIVTPSIAVATERKITDDQDLAQVDWTLSYQLNDETIEYAGKETLSVARERPLKSLRRFQLDGELDEWSRQLFYPNAEGAFFNTEGFHGDADASFRWAAARHQDGLVLAVEVVDDHLQRSADGIVPQQDFVYFTLDARTQVRRSIKQTYDNRVPGQQTLALLAPSKAIEPELRGDPELPEGVDYAARQTEKGYSAEIFIPEVVLDSIHGSPWTGVRLNVQLRDADPNEPGPTGRQWMPSWGTEWAVGGSGNFYR